MNSIKLSADKLGTVDCRETINAVLPRQARHDSLHQRLSAPSMARATFLPGHLLAATLLVSGAACAQDDEKAPDNGTDPTRFSTQVAVQYEHIVLRGDGRVGSLKLSYGVPLGEKKDYFVRGRVPVGSNNVFGDSSFGLGDASVTLGHFFGLTREHGFVVLGELFFDTAKRPELGNGKAVFKGTFIYANFLSNGAIFAPAVVQSIDLGGNSARAKVNNTVLDFYYVPKLSDPKFLVTLDPALSSDWESKKQFASLAVTVGRIIGPAFGGSAQVFVKPSVFVGGERPANWGVEVGYKVIGF